VSSTIRGVVVPYLFNANGLLSAFADGVAGTFTSAAMIDGSREVWNADQFIQTMRWRQVDDGGGGTTAVEVFRRRAGVLTSLGVISLASGGGAFASAATVPATVALQTLLIGDVLVCQFNTRQTTTAANGTVEIGLR
jgi:hypothetical protein